MLMMFQYASTMMCELRDLYHRLIQLVHHEGNLLDFITVHDFNQIISNATKYLPPQAKIITQETIKMSITTLSKGYTISGYTRLVDSIPFTIMSATSLPPNTSFSRIIHTTCPQVSSQVSTLSWAKGFTPNA